LSHLRDRKPRLIAAGGRRDRDLALSLSKGGRRLPACFDKLSTGLLDWAGESVSSAEGIGAFAGQHHWMPVTSCHQAMSFF
jgi:hypothetical protein